MIFEKSADNSLHQKKTWLGKKLVQWFGQKVTDDKYYWNGLLYDAANIESAEDALGNLGRKWTGSGLTSADVEQNQFNAEQAELAYQRQRELRQTAYQDTVKDAAAAGINPYFAVSGTATGAQSAPLASASPQSGSPAGLDSVLNLLFAKQRFDLNRAQIRLAKAERQVKEESANNLAADTEVKKESVGNLAESTRGLRISNDFLEQTFDARKESVNLTNNLTREEARRTRKAIDVADEQIELMIQQEKSEERRQELMSSQSLLARANAYQIVSLTPYMQLEIQARSDQEHASARALAVSAAYQQGLIDNGMIKAEVRRANAAASSDEVQAEVQRVEKELKLYQDDVNHGRISKIAEGSDTVVGGLFATIKTAVDLVKP